MKRISEVLLNTYSYYEHLDSFEQHILQHLYIDYKLGHVYSTFNVNEDYATYNKLRDIVAVMSLKIERILSLMHIKEKTREFDVEFSYKDFNDIDKVFFEQSTIHIKFSEHNDSSYSRKSIKISPKTYMLNKVDITLYLHDEDYRHDNIIFRKLMHEMTHAYDDYYSLAQKGHLFDVAEDILKQTKAVVHPDVEEEQYLAAVIYFNMDVEQSAFENELIAELKAYNKDVKTPKEALDVIRSTRIYNAYKNLLLNINAYKENKLSQESVDIITNKFNEIFQRSYDSNTIFKKLYDRIDSSIKRFENLAGELCLEHLSKSCRFETGAFRMNSILEHYKMAPEEQVKIDEYRKNHKSKNSEDFTELYLEGLLNDKELLKYIE